MTIEGGLQQLSRTKQLGMDSYSGRGALPLTVAR